MSLPEFYNRKHAEGYVLAHARIGELAAKMKPVDRYQPTWALKNMIKALSLMCWQNTVEDWQRLEEAKIILQLRRR